MRSAGSGIIDDLHSHGAADGCHFLADGTHAHNAQGFSRQFHERMGKIHVHGVLAVGSAPDEILVMEGAAHQVENVHPGRLGHGIRGIGRHVPHDDTPLFAKLHIDVVDARAGLADEPELGCGVQKRLVHNYFVKAGHIGIFYPFAGLLGRR